MIIRQANRELVGMFGSFFPALLVHYLLREFIRTHENTELLNNMLRAKEAVVSGDDTFFKISARDASALFAPIKTGSIVSGFRLLERKKIIETTSVGQCKYYRINLNNTLIVAAYKANTDYIKACKYQKIKQAKHRGMKKPFVFYIPHDLAKTTGNWTIAAAITTIHFMANSSEDGSVFLGKETLKEWFPHLKCVNGLWKQIIETQIIESIGHGYYRINNNHKWVRYLYYKVEKGNGTGERETVWDEKGNGSVQKGKRLECKKNDQNTPEPFPIPFPTLISYACEIIINIESRGVSNNHKSSKFMQWEPVFGQKTDKFDKYEKWETVDGKMGNGSYNRPIPFPILEVSLKVPEKKFFQNFLSSGGISHARKKYKKIFLKKFLKNLKTFISLKYNFFANNTKIYNNFHAYVRDSLCGDLSCLGYSGLDFDQLVGKDPQAALRCIEYLLFHKFEIIIPESAFDSLRAADPGITESPVYRIVRKSSLLRLLLWRLLERQPVEVCCIILKNLTTFYGNNDTRSEGAVFNSFLYQALFHPNNKAVELGIECPEGCGLLGTKFLDDGETYLFPMHIPCAKNMMLNSKGNPLTLEQLSASKIKDILKNVTKCPKKASGEGGL